MSAGPGERAADTVTVPVTPAEPAASPPIRRSRARRGEGERLRDEILAAAEAMLIATNDESALSIRAIAAAVGVTPPSIYLHFADRSELIFAVCERHWLQLDRAMEDATAGVADPVERIRRRGEAYLRFGIEHPEQYRVLMMSRPGDTPARFTDERLAGMTGMGMVAGDLEEAIAAGLLPPQDVTQAAMILWIVAHGMVAMLVAKPDFPFPPLEQLSDRCYRLIVGGLGGRV